MKASPCTIAEWFSKNKNSVDESSSSTIRNMRSASSEISEERRHAKKAKKVKETDNNPSKINGYQVLDLSMSSIDMEEVKAKVQSLGFRHELRSWQIKLIKLIYEEPDDRTIYWVYGPTGGEGKTEFAKFISLNEDGWTYITGGSTASMVRCLESDDIENNVVLDFYRSGYVNYMFIKDVKDRTMVIHGRSVVRYILLNKVHVVVFSCKLPLPGKISQDQIKILYC